MLVNLDLCKFVYFLNQMVKYKFLAIRPHQSVENLQPLRCWIIHSSIRSFTNNFKRQPRFIKLKKSSIMCFIYSKMGSYKCQSSNSFEGYAGHKETTLI